MPYLGDAQVAQPCRHTILVLQRHTVLSVPGIHTINERGCAAVPLLRYQLRAGIGEAGKRREESAWVLLSCWLNCEVDYSFLCLGDCECTVADIVAFQYGYGMFFCPAGL